jgi:cyclophilin family peptidyl-prolyl cis-trans isomerase
MRHEIAGLVSMANKGYRDSNNSQVNSILSSSGQLKLLMQFTITTCPRPDLDGRNVIFGQVVEGLSVIVDVTQKYGSSLGTPVKKVVIGRAGMW